MINSAVETEDDSDHSAQSDLVSQFPPHLQHFTPSTSRVIAPLYPYISFQKDDRHLTAPQDQNSGNSSDFYHICRSRTFLTTEKMHCQITNEFHSRCLMNFRQLWRYLAG